MALNFKSDVGSDSTPLVLSNKIAEPVRQKLQQPGVFEMNNCFLAYYYATMRFARRNREQWLNSPLLPRACDNSQDRPRYEVLDAEHYELSAAHCLDRVILASIDYADVQLRSAGKGCFELVFFDYYSGIPKVRKRYKRDLLRRRIAQ